MKNISWDDYKIAYQVAVDGSLSQAGKSLGINHATVLRRINQLESALEIKLFIRHQRGYKLTDAGYLLLDEMPDLFVKFATLENNLKNVEGNISGELRITTVSTYTPALAPALSAFIKAYPDIRIKLISTDDIISLDSGVTHVSLRIGPKPDGVDLIAKELTQIHTSYYADKNYVQEFGLPQSINELNAHAWVLPTPNKYRIPFVRYVTDKIDKKNIVFQSNHFPDVSQAVIAGMGIGPLENHLASLNASLVEVPLDLPISKEAIWFVYHKDLKHSIRLQCFYEFLKNRLQQ
ncbi:MAG: LysR family transcriptional regulator [Colwellia sp.]